MRATLVPTRILLPVAAFGLLLAASIGAALLGTLAVGPVRAPAPSAVADIPALYLAAYEASAARFELGPEGWSYLAAIGDVESDHGRSTAPGVRAGQNANGCCAGPMQIHNGFGSGGGTWGAFKVDGGGDGRTDIYDPADAISTAARYLRSSGAPVDWHRALFAYNHADWYVDEVDRQAATYRDAAGAPPTDDVWLAPVPGVPG